MVAGLGDLAVVQDDDLVCVADGVEPVGDDEDGAMLDEPGQGLLDGVFVDRVERGGGFVEQQDGCALGDGAGDGDPLSFPPDRVRPPSPIRVS